MRGLWVRHELSHGMLLRSLGSFLRCDDTLVDSGSGKWKSEKAELIIWALKCTFYDCFTSFCNRPTQNWSFIRFPYDHTVHLI